MVSIRNISKRYGKKKQVFEDFSLELPGGRIIGLLGENGIGKTTLLKMIADLAKPYAGEILINVPHMGGSNAGGSSAGGSYMGSPHAGKQLLVSRHTRDLVSFYLEPDVFEDYMKVKDVIKYWSDFYPDFNLEKAEEMCKAFGLNGGDKISKLSKGHKARVSLMLCLCRNVPLYLLDEPMSGFDPKFKRDMVEAILTYFSTEGFDVGNTTEGPTLIISSHLLRDLETIFDEVVILKASGAAGDASASREASAANAESASRDASAANDVSAAGAGVSGDGTTKVGTTGSGAIGSGMSGSGTTDNGAAGSGMSGSGMRGTAAARAGAVVAVVASADEIRATGKSIEEFYLEVVG